MKTKTITPILFLLFLTQTAPAQWASQNSGTTEVLLGLSFTDSNTGWACGTAGKILRTTGALGTVSK